MPKKILLFDNELIMTEQILKHTDWVISVLITREDKRVRSSRIKAVYLERDFWNNSDLSYLDFNVLNFFWFAQLKIENCTNREIADYQKGKWEYYRGFS